MGRNHKSETSAGSELTPDILASQILLHHGQCTVHSLRALGAAGLTLYSYSLAAAATENGKISVPALEVLGNAPLDLQEQAARILMDNGKAALNAATVIYAHAIAEEFLMRICRCSAQK